jgi:glucarate dehydratase
MRGLSRVNAKVPWMALASNMAVFGMDDLLPAIQSDVVDVVLLDPHWYGGVSRARLAGQVCELANVDVGMHSGAELGVSLAAMLHLAAVLPNLAVAIDTHYHHLVDDVITGGLMPIEEGAIEVPAGPGLGVDLDRDKLARYAELASRQSMGGWTDHGGTDGPVTVLPKW